MVVNGTDYTGINPNTQNPVFDEEVRSLLNQIQDSTISPQDLLNNINLVEEEVTSEHQDIVDTIANVAVDQMFDLSFIKEIMSEDGRILVHNEKLAIQPSFNGISAGQQYVGTTINGGSSGNDFVNTFQKVMVDSRKNTITISKLINNCTPNTNAFGYDNMTPIFSVSTQPCKRKYLILNNTIGKLLLEVRISTPLLNFKGYITTGILDNKYGIGFFAEYCKSVDNNDFIITAFVNNSNNNISFFIVKRATTTLAQSSYDLVIPTKIDITPLICGPDLLIDQSIGIMKNITDVISSGYYPIGTGNLNMNGHGPIDCVASIMPNETRIDFSYIKSMYYSGNKDSKCKTNVPVKARTLSKYFNLKIQPSSLGPNPSTDIGSQSLRPTFGKNHFDMINLLNQIYSFSDKKVYKCFGNIVLNNIFIPVVGFSISKSLGRASFIISPYFIIPENLKYKDTSNINPTQYYGVSGTTRSNLRNPLIVFTTNVNRPHTSEPSGFTGDVDSDSLFESGINPTSLFLMGYDSEGYVYTCQDVDYSLSLVDINIEISDSNGLFNKVQWDTPFRYSGDFNKYTYDFTKNDFDSYPYPGDNRDISGNASSIVNIPSLVPENLIIKSSDDGKLYCWSDDQTTLIDYVNNNLQQ